CRVGVSHDRQARALGTLPRRRNEFGEVESSAMQPEAPRFELSAFEEVVRDSVEVAALTAQLIDRAALGRGKRGCPREIRDRRLDLACRSAQRVRDKGQRLLAMRV